MVLNYGAAVLTGAALVVFEDLTAPLDITSLR